MTRPILPPPDWSPSRLFLKLLEFPRPRLPLGVELAAAPDVALEVQAISQLEFRQALLDKPKFQATVVAHAVVGPDGHRVFRDARDVGELAPREMAAVGHAVMAQLARCGPLLGVIDVDIWRRTLIAGAAETAALAGILASSGTWILGLAKPVFRDEPERYWGCARRDLLDGHWLAYRAARKWIDPQS